MLERNSSSEKERKFTRDTKHARVLTPDERFTKHIKKRDNKEKKKAENKDRFARIIHIDELVINSNADKTFRKLIIFTDNFEILKIKIFSKNSFLLDQKINIRKKNSEYHTKIEHPIKVKHLPKLSISVLQNILVRRLGFKKRLTINEIQDCIDSNRDPKKSGIGVMPKRVHHDVYQDHGFQFPHG